MAKISVHCSSGVNSLEPDWFSEVYSFSEAKHFDFVKIAPEYFNFKSEFPHPRVCLSPNPLSEVVEGVKMTFAKWE